MRNRFIACAVVAFIAAPALAVLYPSNGGTGFGGPLGAGSIEVSDTATSLTLKVNRGTGNLNDHVAIYFDTKAGGLSDTSSLTDVGDGGRSSLSGAKNGRALVNFPSGFGADYGSSVEGGFWGNFDILNSPSNFTYLFGASQGGNGSNVFSLTLDAVMASQIGLTLGSGQTFSFVATLVSSSSFRSNEAVGDLVGFPFGNPGFASTITFGTARSYTLTTIPEPGLLGLTLVGPALIARRRR